MADIVVTIPRREYKNDDKETKVYQATNGATQFWTLPSRPRNLNLGNRVYFVRDGRVESSMRVCDIQAAEPGGVIKMKCDVTGREWVGPCIISMDDLKDETDLNIKNVGFRGYKYKWWVK